MAAAVKPITTAITEIETRVRNMAQEWARLFNEGDFDSLVAMYLPDAVVMPPHQRAAPGTMAIRELLKWYREGGVRDLKCETTRVVQSPEFVLEIGAYTAGVALPTGVRMIDRGKYLTNLQRQSNGEFRIIFHCWNSDLPPLTTP